MKSTSSVSFIIATLLYGALLLSGYWLFSLETKEPTPLLEKTSVLPVTLNMFQPAPPAPIIQTIETPPKFETKVIEKPIIEPVELVEPVKPAIEPVVKPKPIPEPVLKPKPIIAEPIIKKIVNPVKPIAEPVKKPITKAPAQPSLAPSSIPAKSKAEPPAPQVSKQQQANAEQAYLHALRSEILLHAQDTYPRRAKRRQWEGVVTLSFTLVPSGKILNLAIQTSSGRQILDDAATSIFQNKMHNEFQPFPKEIARKEWKITIPVSYNLR